MADRPSARELLAPGGELAERLVGYEARPGQLSMAAAVERALEDQSVLLCEAGTGTGKTFAYLVPAVLSGARIVVSTATKALQDQIANKDLPLVEAAVGRSAEAMVVKGLGNYICRRRLQEALTSPVIPAEVTARRGLLDDLLARAEQRETGDLDELGLGERDALRNYVSSSADTRIGAGCSYFESCFVTRMKREAARARLWIVNHHLFFADLAVKAGMDHQGAPSAGVLPPYDAVIFDEAHRLEDIATLFFGTRVSRRQMDRLLVDVERTTSRALSSSAPSVSALLAAARSGAAELFSAIRAVVPAIERTPRVSLPPDVWRGAVLDAYHRWDNAFDAVGSFAETHAVDEGMLVLRRRIESLRQDVASIVDPATYKVTWAGNEDVQRVHGPPALAMGASPIEVAALLRDRVFERVGGCVLTSATLRISRDERGFAYARRRFGLVAPCSFGVEELAVDAPFDVKNRALLYVASDLPGVDEPTFLDALRTRIVELVEASGGGAFVLCTSNRVVRALDERLRSTQLPGRLLVQGQADKSSLLEQFRQGGNDVLLATMSFWEGVDVPGPALRLVMIDRLPFAVPTDPVVEARMAAVEAKGGRPFQDVSLPEAALTLKQGFGRLLRSHGDYGVVAILDHRAVTRRYGRDLLDALPPARQTGDLEEVRRFFSSFETD